MPDRGSPNRLQDRQVQGSGMHPGIHNPPLNVNSMSHSRRTFLINAALAAGGGLLAAPLVSLAEASLPGLPESGLPLPGHSPAGYSAASRRIDFTISLAQWSLHRTLRSGALDNLDFPAKAKEDFGIDAVEYVSTFFRDKAEDRSYLSDLKRRTDDLGVRNVLIMIDGEGNLASTDRSERRRSVENHHKWVDAAARLGCHAIRVNLYGTGTAEEWTSASVESLGWLAEYGGRNRIRILVENHGGFSSNGRMVAEVMRQVGSPWAGTLPDFGNFCIRREEGRCAEAYDPYQGTRELMPFEGGVSAKTYDFDENGMETTIDFRRMFRILQEFGFSGFIGVEYEGQRLPEEEGIRKSKELLEKMRQEFS